MKIRSKVRTALHYHKLKVKSYIVKTVQYRLPEHLKQTCLFVGEGWIHYSTHDAEKIVFNFFFWGGRDNEIQSFSHTKMKSECIKDLNVKDQKIKALENIHVRGGFFTCRL